MDRVAQASSADRADLFQRAAAILKPERSPSIVEKDFWVCWVLYRLYEVIRFHPRLVFKGGTSLSKVYNVIDRFSEDVDLSLSQRDLGFEDDRSPEQAKISANERERRIDAIVDACKNAIREHLLPNLKSDFTNILGSDGWSIALDQSDPQTIIFAYPSSDVSDGMEGYIRPAIRLELGARADDWPAGDHSIQSYAAKVFPQAFTIAKSCRVHALEAERTFWEKATILHAEYHRPNLVAGDRLSRHFYDLYQLSKNDIADRALSRMDLLKRVVEHKKIFFRRGWAHYDTAVPGTFRLIPSEERLDVLRADYAQMKVMIFGDYPAWEVIVQALTELEKRINV